MLDVENEFQVHSDFNPAAPLLFTILTFVLLGVIQGRSGPDARAERQVYVMGTALRLEVHAGSLQAATEAAAAAVEEVERMDRLLTTWDPASAMSSINRAPAGRATAPEPELLRLLAEVEARAEGTGRAFDPSVGALVDAWELRGRGRRPAPEALRAALALVGATAYAVDASRGTVTRRRDGVWIDTGGFGKGAALRTMADTLRARGISRAIADLGGQIVALADSSESREVGVAHPARRHESVATLRLSGVSAATSGNSERGIEVDGERLGHILDPRTGLPCPSWGSVTVVSADPLEADVLSTALYVMGPDAGLAWARDLRDVGVLFLVEADDGLLLLSNQAMQRWLVQPLPPQPLTTQPSLERRFP